MRFYESLHLPDLTSFRNEKIEMPKGSKPRALDTGVIGAINAAAPKLAANDPAVYVAFLMFSRPGLRNVEIRNARWNWIENSRHSQEMWEHAAQSDMRQLRGRLPGGAFGHQQSVEAAKSKQ